MPALVGGNTNDRDDSNHNGTGGGLMARHRFGGDTAAWATATGDDATTANNMAAKVALFVPGAEVTFWNNREGGVQYTDMVDTLGDPITYVTCDERGFWPEFDGPIDVWTMYADASGGTGPRYLVAATDAGPTAEQAAYLDHLELVEPGLVAANKWRPSYDVPDPDNSAHAMVIGGIGRKP